MQDAGAYAEDDRDGSLKVSVAGLPTTANWTHVVTSEPFEVVYTASDRSFNTAHATRLIEVRILGDQSFFSGFVCTVSLEELVRAMTAMAAG